MNFILEYSVGYYDDFGYFDHRTYKEEIDAVDFNDAKLLSLAFLSDLLAKEIRQADASELGPFNIDRFCDLRLYEKPQIFEFTEADLRDTRETAREVMSAKKQRSLREEELEEEESAKRQYLKLKERFEKS